MIFLIASANQSKPIEFIIAGFIISWKFIWLSNHTQGKNVRNLCINWQVDNRIKSYFSFTKIVISEDVKKPLRSATLILQNQGQFVCRFSWPFWKEDCFWHHTNWNQSSSNSIALLPCCLTSWKNIYSKLYFAFDDGFGLQNVSNCLMINVSQCGYFRIFL